MHIFFILKNELEIWNRVLKLDNFYYVYRVIVIMKMEAPRLRGYEDATEYDVSIFGDLKIELGVFITCSCWSFGFKSMCILIAVGIESFPVQIPYFHVHLVGYTD